MTSALRACTAAMQDVHWSAGAFAYFPTYSLGAMFATQLMEHARTVLPGLDDQLAAGNFAPLRVRTVALHLSCLCLKHFMFLL